MATAVKKAAAGTAKKATVKKASSKKVPAKKAKKAPARKIKASKPAKGNVFSEALNDAREQIDKLVDSAKLRAKRLAAQEKLVKKKAELAARTELDKAKHLADQAEKWMKTRLKSDTRKLNALEKKLSKQLRDTERKLASKARAAEKKAAKKTRQLKKKLDEAKQAVTEAAGGKPAPKARRTPKKAAAPAA